MMKKIALFLMVLICLALCACKANNGVSLPPELFQAKQISGNSSTLPCDVYLEKIGVVKSTYDSSIYQLQLSGNFSNTCQDLQVVTTVPDANNVIKATFGAVGAPRPAGDNKRVVVDLKPFYISVPLREITKGKYKIEINQEQIYEFEIQ